MSLAQIIRDFFRTLFQSELTVELRHELEEARRERDYFKANCTRLELLLTQPREAHRIATGLPDPGHRPSAKPIVGGRKTWAQLVKERREDLAKKALEAQSKKNPAPSAQNLGRGSRLPNG